MQAVSPAWPLDLKSDRGRSVGKTPAQPFSLYGHLVFLGLTIVGSAVSRDAEILLLLPWVLLWAWVLDAKVLGKFKRPRFWLFILSVVVISTLAWGEEGERVIVAGVALSRQGLLIGVWMALRTIIVLTAMSVFARAASVSELAALFARLGVKELGFILGIALNLLPLVQETARNTLLAMRLRGGFRRHKLRALRRVVVTILVNCLRYSDDVVCAAEARAFNNQLADGSLASPRITVRRGDYLLVGLALPLLIAILVL